VPYRAYWWMNNTGLFTCPNCGKQIYQSPKQFWISGAIVALICLGSLLTMDIRILFGVAIPVNLAYAFWRARYDKFERYDD